MKALRYLVFATCVFWTGAQAVWAGGNLAVELIDDTLFVIGDQEVNSVLISEFHGRILIAGRATNDCVLYTPWMTTTTCDFLAFAGSDVNNGDDPIFGDASLVSQVVIITGRGTDRIMVRGVVTADLIIDSGSGDDRITTFSGAARAGAHSLCLNTGLGRDTLSIGQIDVAGSVQVSTGNDDDLVFVANANVLGDLEINTGAKDDFLFLDDVAVQGDVLVQTGQGHDSVVNIFADVGIRISGFGRFEGGQGTDVLDVAIEIVDPTLLEITGYELFELP